MSRAVRHLAGSLAALAAVLAASEALAQPAPRPTPRRPQSPPAQPAPDAGTNPEGEDATESGVAGGARGAQPAGDAGTTAPATGEGEGEGAATGEGEDATESGAATGQGAGAGTGEGESEAEQEASSGQQTPPEEPPVAPLTPEQRARLVAAPGDLSDRPEPGTRRFVLPPYYYDWGPNRHTRVVFPLYFENRERDQTRLLIGPYYRSRGPNHETDIAFPLYFRFRGRGESNWSTDVIPPVWVHTSRGPGRAHAAAYGAFPFFSYGETFDRRGRLDAEHLVIPGLLTFHRWWPTGQTTVVGGIFAYVRDRSTVDWGLFPFVLHHTSPRESWTATLPFIYHRVNHEENRTFTVVGPWVSETGPNGLGSYNFAPIFFHWHDRDSSRTTFAPLFHTSSGRDRFAFFTLLGGYAREGRESTLVTPLYQNHRGVDEFDAIAPLFVYARSPRRGAHTVASLLPVPWLHSASPAGSAWGIFPLLGRFQEYGRYDTWATPLFVHSNVRANNSSTTWVLPTIHHHAEPGSGLFNIYPLVWTAHGRDWHHSAVAPFFIDVGNRTAGTRVTVAGAGVPLFVRVASRTNVTQWTFPNHVFWEERRNGQTSFGWDLFPFVQYGEPRRGDVYWSIFHGLVGYRRNGQHEQLRLFYIPITLRGAPPTRAQARR